jgi:hypothetical protein
MVAAASKSQISRPLGMVSTILATVTGRYQECLAALRSPVSLPSVRDINNVFHSWEEALAVELHVWTSS